VSSSSLWLPTTADEVRARGWDAVDVVFVTGDAYVDHPSFAMAVLGRVLESKGFRVAILAQPDWKSADAWRALGRPRLFYAVSAGNMDSMINHYTANRKRRNDDAYSEGGAIGQWIEWRGRRMTLVGVIRDEAVFPYTLFLPYRTVMEMADARYITGLIARPIPGESWARATRELQRVLGGLGGFDPNDANALEIEDNSAFTSRVEAVTTALHALVVGIAGVSLLLGGLGVANLMVIAVTERTREIGLRKALGAAPGSIFCQILCESLTVLSVGGLLGIAAGWTTCVALGSIRVSATYTAHARFDPASAALSLLGLALVAALASIIPARRAAALPAAEALRWE